MAREKMKRKQNGEKKRKLNMKNKGVQPLNNTCYSPPLTFLLTKHVSGLS